jgi:trehalose/maltose hydrolase-like predicted phosphorylase
MATGEEAIEAFNPFVLRIESNGSRTFRSQVLNMFNGTIRTSHAIGDNMDVCTEVYAVRHLPHTAVMNVTITPNSDEIKELDISHVIRASEGSFGHGTLEYNNNLLHTTADHPVHLLTGNGKLLRKPNVSIAVCCSYVLPPTTVTSVGYNRSKVNPLECYQKLRITGLRAGVQTSFTILASQMSTEDNPDAYEELKRIHLNLASLGQDQQKKLRAAHVKAWLQTWKANIHIEPKSSASDSEKDTIKTLSKTVRYSLYQLWTCIREGSCIEVSAATPPFLDTGNTLVKDGDVFFMPLLTLFKPNIVKRMLSRRYANIEQAMQAAASYGYCGCQFPYVNNVNYWDATAPMHLFNTAFIGVAVWNYYRVTMDKGFMMDKGYTILKNIADFFVSRVSEKDDASGYVLENVSGMSSISKSDNHAMTTYLVKAVLQCAVEASYELQAVVNPAWSDVYFNLNLSLDHRHVVSNEDDGGELADVLLPLTLLYSEYLTKPDPTLDINKVIRANLEATAQYKDNGFNTLLRCWLRMTIGDGSGCQQILDKLLEGSYIDPVWGGFSNDDLNLSSMFLLMLVNGAGTVRFSGNITDTRFYSERMGIKASATSSAATMPHSWKCIRMTGLSSKSTSFTIANETK